MDINQIKNEMNKIYNNNLIPNKDKVNRINTLKSYIEYKLLEEKYYNAINNFIIYAKDFEKLSNNTFQLCNDLDINQTAVKENIISSI